MHTLLIADNFKQALFVQKGLQYENIGVDVFHHGSLKHIIDNLYKVDGVYLLIENDAYLESIIKECRKIKLNIPIMVLGQGYKLIYKVFEERGMINNYYIRPFPFRKMASEMKYMIFDMKESMEQEVIKLRGLEMDLGSHQVKCNGKSVYLRNKEFALLHFLMINIGKVFSRTAILDNVWDRNTNILTNTVDVHISQLRKKLSDFTSEKYIYTIPCSGYLIK